VHVQLLHKLWLDEEDTHAPGDGLEDYRSPPDQPLPRNLEDEVSKRLVLSQQSKAGIPFQGRLFLTDSDSASSDVSPSRNLRGAAALTFGHSPQALNVAQ
jgi:hypothetical protein